MSDTLRNPEEKTMAFGGVATGSMKAKEALKVQGIMTYSGFMPMDCDCTRRDRPQHSLQNKHPKTVCERKQ